MKTYLKKFLIFASTAMLAGCGSSSNSDTAANTPPPTVPGTEAKTVIVIGAGIAGIKAAHKLDAAGFNVQVLEGRDRIGGRMHSDNRLGTVVDLGASWIHGINGNPVHELAQSQNVTMHTWDYDNYVLYNIQGQIDHNLSDRLFSAIDNLENWAIDAVIANSNATMADAFTIGKNNGDLEGFTNEQINFMEVSTIEHEAAADVEDLAIAPMENLDGFDGPEVVFPNGYDALVKNLAQGLEVKLNTWVSAINYSTEQITVNTSIGDFSADYVIVTVPLGVLKKEKIAFNPQLPEQKRTAINGLDMGVLNKVYLKFDEIFWDNNITNMGKITAERGYYANWLNLEPSTGMPILMAFNGAEFAKQTENLSEEKVVEQAMEVLKDMYGDNIPTPTAHIVTRWHNDNFSFGSYSYVPKGANADMRNHLAAPVESKLFFAGEATHELYPSTVHGAYLSGEREADRIIALN